MGKVIDIEEAKPHLTISDLKKKKGNQFYWREIGEGDWMPCDEKWYRYCEKSPEHDTTMEINHDLHNTTNTTN